MTEQSQVIPTRMTDRVQSLDWAPVARLIDEVAVAHVGFATDAGHPVVIPIAVAVNQGDLLLHGSTGSRWLRLLATGVPVAAAVTAVDGLVVARSAFESSMRYRSVVLFGSCTIIEGPDKSAALDLIANALIPGRVAELRRPSDKELAATLVLRLTVSEFSLKVAAGWPEDSDSDVAGQSWAGVLPRKVGYHAPLPAPDLGPGIAIPDSVLRLC